MHWFYESVRHFLISWGYWALLLGLFGESMGLPLPGETVLMFASFLSNKDTGLQIQWIILVGIAAAVLGDNLGYLLGQKPSSAGRKNCFAWMSKTLPQPRI